MNFNHDVDNAAAKVKNIFFAWPYFLFFHFQTCKNKVINKVVENLRQKMIILKLAKISPTAIVWVFFYPDYIYFFCLNAHLSVLHFPYTLQIKKNDMKGNIYMQESNCWGDVEFLVIGNIGSKVS